MTTLDYLINGGFIVMVFMQARERRLDRRALVVPLVIVFFVAQQYLHTIPVGGNDLVLVGALVAAGVSLGVVGGFATHVRVGDQGFALARVGWIAGGLLVAGIGSRMVFAFAVTHGAEGAIRDFSITHQIDAAAWPVALVSMALCEVVARLVTVQLRGLRLRTTSTPASVAAGASA